MPSCLTCSTSLLQDLTSEERFHVELHFSPGVKGVEEEENAPTGFGFRPASAEVARQVGPHPRESQPQIRSSKQQSVHSFLFSFFSSSASFQNGQKQTDPGSLEDLSRDETDRAVPLSEPITIQRRSPLIRNHKTGSMEVMRTDPAHRESLFFVVIVVIISLLLLSTCPQSIL